MGSVCPSLGDMDDCSKKPRCAWGVCEGQSLPSDPANYCPINTTFREEFCDCADEGGGGCSQRFDITYRVDGNLTNTSCRTGACTLEGEPYFRTLRVEMPFLPPYEDSAERYWEYIGSFHHGAISASCDNGPVNCDRTVGSYGVTGIFNDNGRLSSDEDALFPCGITDSLYAIFRNCCTGETVGYFLIWTAFGGVACTLEHTSVVEVLPIGDDTRDTCPIEAFRQWRFYYDYYGSILEGFSEPGIRCCEGYTLGSKIEIKAELPHTCLSCASA